MKEDPNHANLTASPRSVRAAQWIYERELPWTMAWVDVLLTDDLVSVIGQNRFP